LPPAFAGGIWNNLALAVAKKYAILAKANKNHSNFIPPAKAGGK